MARGRPDEGSEAGADLGVVVVARDEPERKPVFRKVLEARQIAEPEAMHIVEHGYLHLPYTTGTTSTDCSPAWPPAVFSTPTIGATSE